MLNVFVVPCATPRALADVATPARHAPSSPNRLRLLARHHRAHGARGSFRASRRPRPHNPAPYTTLAAAGPLHERGVPFVVDYRDGWSIDVVNGVEAFGRRSRRGRIEQRLDDGRDPGVVRQRTHRRLLSAALPRDGRTVPRRAQRLRRLRPPLPPPTSPRSPRAAALRLPRYDQLSQGADERDACRLGRCDREPLLDEPDSRSAVTSGRERRRARTRRAADRRYHADGVS